jgi:ribosome-binding factor A
MSYLDVFVSSIKNNEVLCKKLAKYAQKVKEDINKKITLRKTPIIRFRYNNEMEFSSDLISKIGDL